MGFLYSVFFIVLSIILNKSLLHLPVTAKDMLIPGDELNSRDSASTLSSANGIFTLGFFTISSTNSTYLGIWYTNDGIKVWVANRETPMIGSGVLKIDDSGILKVVNSSGITLFNIFHNQVHIGNNNTRAVLEDSGNFIVYFVTNGVNRTLYQSFDYPTDTLLAGMKLGYNLTTNQNWTLVSWLSDQVPATGIFTMCLKQYENSAQLVIYKGGEVYWTSGPWKNESSQFLDSTIGYLFPPNYYESMFSDFTGMYFSYRAIDFSFRLTSDGQIIGHNSSRSILNANNFCYGYERDSSSCAVFAVPNCRGRNDSFEFLSGDWIGGSSNYDSNSSISLDDCMERCWKDCNCLGFNNNGTGCMIWIKNNNYMQFSEDQFGNTAKKYVLVSEKPSKKKKTTWIWIVVSLASAATSVLAAYLCYLRIRKLKEKKRKDDFIHQLTGSNSFNFGNELEIGIKDAPNVKVFSLKAILAATDNFSNGNKLGEGGYGPVYKGRLFDGREIAVKRLSKTSGQGIDEFKSELILISKLQHTNLVRLYGCCIHQEEKMLIYEFMPNKSLDLFLFAEDKNEKIDWQVRFNIIEGVAQGLLYLHKYSRMRVIHRDLKASNVLLDENMNPKIADFGMARIFQSNVTEGKTRRVVGTYGYIAPEYAMRGTFSIKSDVFSFGVLILEIVSGKKNSSFNNYDRTLNLMGYAWELWKGQAALELKDKSLSESYDVRQLLRAIHVGLLCVQESADDRPTMSEVVSMLNNDMVDISKPKRPAFFVDKRSVENGLVDEIMPYSVNDLTVTVVGPR